MRAYASPVAVRLAVVAACILAGFAQYTAGAYAQGTPAAAAPPQPTLDFDYYRARVEPIFQKKREGHTRCAVCHAESNNAFRLEKPGASGFSAEQSHKNFVAASALVTPGKPRESRLLLHPLAPEGGGDVFHSGGRQFASRNDHDWKALARWINGAKLADRAGSRK